MFIAVSRHADKQVARRSDGDSRFWPGGGSLDPVAGHPTTGDRGETLGGNAVRGRSTYTRTDGTTRETVAVDFRANSNAISAAASDTTPQTNLDRTLFSGIRRWAIRRVTR